MNSNLTSSCKVGIRQKLVNIPEIELNISKLLKRRHSISPRAEKISSMVNNDSPKNRNSRENIYGCRWNKGM